MSKHEHGNHRPRRPQGHAYGCACWNGHGFKVARDLAKEFGEEVVMLTAMELQNRDAHLRMPSVYQVAAVLTPNKPQTSPIGVHSARPLRSLP